MKRQEFLTAVIRPTIWYSALLFPHEAGAEEIASNFIVAR
jgi:hypothetical protein